MTEWEKVSPTCKTNAFMFRIQKVVSDSWTPWTVDCSPLGYSVNGISQQDTGECCHFLLQELFSAQGSNPHFLCLLHWQVDFLPLHHLEIKKQLHQINKQQAATAHILSPSQEHLCSLDTFSLQYYQWYQWFPSQWYHSHQRTHILLFIIQF